MTDDKPTHRDLARFSQELEDVTLERDMLRSEKTDLERSLALTADRLERSEAELERVREQLASASRAAVAEKTVISTIAATLVNHLRPPGAPPATVVLARNGDSHEPEMLGDATIKKIVDNFKPTAQIESKQ